MKMETLLGRNTSQKFTDLKRRAILDAAMAEFEAKGPANASMRAIASGAGVTTGAIYSMFDGKDDLYAALLLESLERLEARVADQVASASSPEDAVRASVMAFFSYYQDRPFEVQLGLHSFAGLTHRSLGAERDRLLNKALLATLDIIGACIAAAGSNLTREQALAERNAMFSCLFGALTMAHTGRAVSIGTTADDIMETHVTSLLKRLEQH